MLKLNCQAFYLSIDLSILTLNFLLYLPCPMYKPSLSSFASLFLLPFLRKQTSLCALVSFYTSNSRLWVLHSSFRTKAWRMKCFFCVPLSNTVTCGGSGLFLPLLKDFGTQFRCAVYPKSPLHITFICTLFPVLELLRS